VTAPRNLGEQLITALAAANPERVESIIPGFPAFAVGYLEGMLNDIGAQSPRARKLIEQHIARQRAKALLL